MQYRSPRLLVGLLAGLAAAGCSAGGQPNAPATAARSFFVALGRGDGHAARQRLSDSARTAVESSDSSCATGVLDLDAEVGHQLGVQVWGTAAQVRYDHDTVFLGIFLALAGQGVAGYFAYNSEQVAQAAPTVSLARYLTSSDFAVDTAENWQSEYLQFSLYIFATVWLVQRGSPESKPLDQIGLGSDEEQQIGRHADRSSPRWASAGGWRGLLYSRSLGLVMGSIFVASLLAQSVAGRVAYNTQQLQQREDPVSWWGYATSAEFWSRTLQNWQSEFLAVASMVARLHGRFVDISQAARFTGIQTRRCPPRGHRNRRLSLGWDGAALHVAAPPCTRQERFAHRSAILCSVYSVPTAPPYVKRYSRVQSWPVIHGR